MKPLQKALLAGAAALIVLAFATGLTLLAVGGIAMAAAALGG